MNTNKRELAKTILHVMVGLLILSRPLFGGGFLVYPYGALINEIAHGDIEASFALLMIIVDAAYLTSGLYVIVHGFEGLRKYRKPVGITAAVFLIGSLFVFGYLFLSK